MKLNRETYKKGAITSSTLSVISKLLAFVMQLLVSFYYGANVGTDLFFYLYGIAILLGGMVQSINSSILVPQAMHLRNEQSAQSEMKFHNTFLVFFSGISLIVLSVLFLLVESGIGNCWFINVEEEIIQQHIITYRLFYLLAFLLIVNLYLSEILVSYRFFTFGLMCNFSMNLCAVLALLLFASHTDIFLLMISSCVACSFFLLAIIWFMRKKLFWNFCLYDISWISIYRKRIVGFAINQLVVIVASVFPMYLLADIQPGLVTLVNYAQKLVLAPLSWIQQIAAVLLVRLNNLTSAEYIQKSQRLVLKTAFGLFAFTLLTSGLTFVLRNFIAENIYGLGKISLEFIPLLSYLIGVMTMAMPFVAISYCFNKKYFAEQRIKHYVYIMLVSNILSCVAYYFFVPLFQQVGYVWVYVLTEIFMCACVVICAKLRF